MQLVESYLNERGGSVSNYHKFLVDGQRPGQAFFNALSPEDKSRIQGTLYDPFYTDMRHSVYEKVEKAIEWLLDTE